MPTFLAVDHAERAGGVQAGPVELMADLRPVTVCLERIAAAIDKIQLVVNIPEFAPPHVTVAAAELHVPAPVVHVAAPVVNPQFSSPDVKVTLPEMKPSILLQASEGQPIAIPAPNVTVNIPMWPIVATGVLPGLAAIVYILVALGVLK